jgi:hypothetical protein
VNATIEHGVAQWLRAQMPSADVRPATTADHLPGDRQIVVVHCPETEHVGGNLHKATVRVSVSTPAHDRPEGDHRTTSAQVAALLSTIAGLDATFTTATGLESRGHFLRSQSETREDTSWVSTAEMVLGIAHIHPIFLD